jgi:hypothetical protein
MSLFNIEEFIDQTNNLPKDISRNMKMLRVIDEEFSSNYKYLNNDNIKTLFSRETDKHSPT